ncbi:hypothetical protein LCGC14_1449400 [marine sediment metagenome]|uniref:DUF1508 domain-containing protein n=2 Tax=root TaxID=1 RepID=A0A831QM08_9FLAO|nr:DUF1508 domain-containing protein [Pricia antarctica]
MSKFEIKKDKAGKLRFNLKAGNHQVILSSEAYNTMASCQNGIESVKKNSKDIKMFEIKTAKDGSLFFNLKATNGQVIGASEMYKSNSGMRNGIASVQKNATIAAISDIS